MTERTAPERFLTLDGMRGVAALAVVVRHLHGYFGLPEPPGSYLAVDLFFALSGLVLASAYAGRLASGMSAASFMRVRIIRLYPLYLAGLAIGGLVALISATTGGDWTLPALAQAAVLALLFLPSRAGPSGAEIAQPFPLNTPAWSLFFELVANAVYGLVAPFLTTLRLAALAGLLGVIHLAAAVHYGSLNLGWDWPTFLGGFSRVGFAFTLGLLLYRAPRPALPAVASLAAMAGLALVMWGSDSVLFGGAFVFVAMPALIYVGASSAPVLPRLCTWLGAISYAIYALHRPFAALVDRVWLKVTDTPLSSHLPYSGLILLAALVVISWLADRFVDVPARAWVNAKRRLASPTAASQAL